MMSRYVLRATLATALIFGASTLAVAQYGGGTGGGMPGSPGTTPSYSASKGAIIGGVAGGAALGGLLYWKLHHRTKLEGCLSPGGDKLVSDKDNQTYTLTNKQGEGLNGGKRVELLGKKTKNEMGDPGFEVYKMNKDLGSCTPTTAEK